MNELFDLLMFMIVFFVVGGSLYCVIKLIVDKAFKYKKIRDFFEDLF